MINSKAQQWQFFIYPSISKLLLLIIQSPCQTEPSCYNPCNPDQDMRMFMLTRQGYLSTRSVLCIHAVRKVHGLLLPAETLEYVLLWPHRLLSWQAPRRSCKHASSHHSAV